MRTILITGVSTGIGAAFVKAACEAHPDWQLVGLSRTKPSYQHPAFTHYEIDLTDHEQTSRLIGSLTKQYKFDTIINNAGAGWRGTIEQTSLSEARQQLELNVWSVVNILRTILPHFRKQHNGLIVNVSSVAAEIDMGTIGYYSATKSFIEKISQVLQLEVRQWNIRVAIFAPGAIKTNFGHSMVNINAYKKAPYAKLYEYWADRFEVMFQKPQTSKNAALKLLALVERDKATKTYVGYRDTVYLTARRLLGERLFSMLLLRRFMKL